VNPLRLLIAAIVVYALGFFAGASITLTLGNVVLSVAPTPIPVQRSIDGTLSQVDRLGVLRRMLQAKIGPIEAATLEIRNRFNESLAHFATPVSFTVVVLLAAVLYVVFRRARPLFVEHLVFGMHYFAFVLLSSLLAELAVKFAPLPLSLKIALLLALMLWQFAYLATAIRSFYLGSNRSKLGAWTLAGAVALCLYLTNTVFITAVQWLGGVIAVWRL
jgi:hypothetical protein